ncbi:hypothetical protein ERJ75_000742500 [Trypanosoma vivax]|uniref:Uncharacterized protein n=1 Tax=Trypanosoma vivax (strain Y486) TaxID=1055687 RepID=G0TYR0_TRYVY|nr:hypothetical protein TRVL_04050 [Trypanosoma vivax]KAH8613972.1 hypothetical protein ERJ75_000742500 [Trypanosoma vivax]CCC49109.1 conserved hypothetical protein [Trypanosoma vivax Y486]
MGWFSKKRHGQMTTSDNSRRRFVWTIQNFSNIKVGSTIDSENVVSFTRVKFHLHLNLNDDGSVGVYMHYKATGIPKYSYYFANSKGLCMRQHTAHTIPQDVERCGHGNVCNQRDLQEFIGQDDVLVINFVFDDDTVITTRKPRAESDSADLDCASCDRVEAIWYIPDLFNQILNPFSSSGIFVDRNLIVIRVEIRRESGTTDAVGEYNINNAKELVFFLFPRKGAVPSHCIELLGDDDTVFSQTPWNEGGGSQPLTVSTEKVAAAISHLGSLRVRVQIAAEGNPLNALNHVSDLLRDRSDDLGESKMRTEHSGQLGQCEDNFVFTKDH